MVRFGLLGAGRIGKIHGGNIAASPDAKLVARRRRRRRGGRRRSPRRPARRCASVDEIIAAKDIDAVLIGTPTDTHADLIEKAARAGKAVLLREAGRPRRQADRGLPEGGRGGRHAADDRLQPPLRPELRGAEGAARRTARSATVEMVTIISRDPGAAAGLLHRALGRPLSRHDDPRFRHGALPPRRGAGRGPRRRLGRWSIRRSARPATSTPRW